MKKEICANPKCGHDLTKHNKVFVKNPKHPKGEWQGDGNCFYFDGNNYCPCKKFEAQGDEKFEPQDELKENLIIVKQANKWWEALEDWQKQTIFMEK